MIVDRPTVVGAGVLGLAIAYRLARLGLSPLVLDPSQLGDNASGVAAGMIAPVFEALLDGDAAHASLLTTARDLWPAFAEDIGAAAHLHRCGALWVGEDVEFESLAERGEARGVRRLTGEQARAHQPALAPRVRRALFSEGDWRCDTGAMLTALRDAAVRAGAELRAETWTGGRGAGPVVVAGGYESRTLGAIAPEVAALTPIKGQLVRLRGGPADGAVVRGAGAYVTPGRTGAVVGASMERGAIDRATSIDVADRLLEAAHALIPGLAAVPGCSVAAVRAATPDGLPLVGPSVAAGIVLAVGARRNGWLLAPLVAELVAAYVAETPSGPLASALDARRFNDAPSKRADVPGFNR